MTIDAIDPLDHFNDPSPSAKRLPAQGGPHWRSVWYRAMLVGGFSMTMTVVWANGPQSIDYLPVGRPPLPPTIQKAIEQGDDAGLDEVARSLKESQQRAVQPPAVEQKPMPSSAIAPAAPVVPAAAPSAAPMTPAQSLSESYDQGQYGAVGTRGLLLLQKDKGQVNDELRLKIANSLAWTNRVDLAIPHYEELIRNSAQAEAARTPLANAYRWQGRPDLALALYRQVLDKDKANNDALEGLEYAERELRPRTTLKMGTSSDSSDLKTRSLILAHRWRDASLAQIYEVETDWRGYDQAPDGPYRNYAGGTFRYEHTGLPLQPRVFLSAQGRPYRGLFGGVKIKLGDLPVHAEVAREAFGITASSARALDADLVANRVGVEGQVGSEWGSLSGRLNLYDISDRNSLTTTSLQYTPNWRPFGPSLKPFVSVETRHVKFHSPNYWSPEDGFGSLGLGMMAEWVQKDWFFYATGQVGTRIYGEAGSSWSTSIGGQRWLSKDVALTANVWAMSSVRDQSRYKAHSFSIKLDKLW